MNRISRRKLLELGAWSAAGLAASRAGAWAQDTAAPATDAYGGSTRAQWEATGWFRLQQNGGRFWMVTPDGHPFFNLGINHLGGGPNKANRDDTALGLQMTRQFQSWNFNTAGYGAPPMYWPHTPFVSAMALGPTSRFLKTKAVFPDVFDPEFQGALQDKIDKQCRRVRDNPRLVGYMWTDTPLWDLKTARRVAKTDWVSSLRELGATAPGKIAYVDFLLETHGDAAKIAKVYGLQATSRAELLAASFDATPLNDPIVAADDRAFLRRIARALYGVAGPAQRKADPHHLVWGDMYFQNDHPPEVLEEAMPHSDLILIQPNGNAAATKPEDHFNAALFDGLHKTYGKPIVIGDHQFSFATPQHPKTMWFQYPTASEAAAAYGAFLRFAANRPYIVGYNRCQIKDAVLPGGMLKQGILQQNGEPYPEYSAQVTAINGQFLEAHYGQLKLKP